MKRIATTIRCVPRLGFETAEVREVDLELAEEIEVDSLRQAMERYFVQRGITDAVYAIDVDDNGYFAIVNDEAYLSEWGTPIL